MKKIFLWLGIFTFSVLIFLIIYNLIVHKELNSGTIVWVQVSNINSYPGKGIVANENYIYTVGSYYKSDKYDCEWQIQKRNLSEGSLVEGFGESGIITNNPSPRRDWPSAIAIDSEYLYVVGCDGSPGMHDSQWRIEKRRLSNGLLVLEFGKSGIITSNPTAGPECASAIVIDDNFMYVAGNEKVSDASPPRYRSDYQWRLEKRNLKDGSLVEDFGDGGIVMTNPNTVEGNAGLEGARSIAKDLNYIYIVGEAYKAFPLDLLWRIEKRRLTDGSLVPEFGEGGIVSSDPSPFFDEAHAIAIDSDYMFIAGRDMVPGTNVQWRIEKRRISDGSLVTDFGNAGVVTNNPSSRVDWATNIVLDREYNWWKRIVNFDFFGNRQAMYVVGRDACPGTRDQQWRIEKRYMTNGSLVEDFGESGVTTINPSRGNDEALAVELDKDHIYVIGLNRGLGIRNSMWQIAKITK